MIRVGIERLDRAAPLIIALFAFLCVAINPIGYVGGGNDDTQYLEAARCWLAQGGPCLPQTHWWSRWPVFAPMAGAIALFGENRTSVGLGALAYWIAAIMLTGWLGSRWFGRAAGLIAATLIAATPILTAAALQPTADLPELTFQLAALAAATQAYRNQSRGWAIIGGVLAGFALQTRDTSLLFVGASALTWLLLPKRERMILLWAIPGLVGTMAAEMLVYWIATGNPLYRFGLAVGHVAIPSDQLPPGFDTRQSPLFNADYIAAWRRELEIEWFWPLDPWINLFASPKVGQILLCALILGLVFAARLQQSHKRSIAILLGASLLVSLLLIYVLAIDPKPRMFLLLVTACVLASGALAVVGWRTNSRALVIVILAIVVGAGVRSLSLHPSTVLAEAEAKRWILDNPGAIEIDANSRAYLALVPEAKPLAPNGSGKPLRIVTVLGTCSEFVQPRPGQRAKAIVIDQQGGPNPIQGRLCLLKYI